MTAVDGKELRRHIRSFLRQTCYAASLLLIHHECKIAAEMYTIGRCNVPKYRPAFRKIDLCLQLVTEICKVRHMKTALITSCHDQVHV